MVDIFCTHWWHLHWDSGGKLCHPSESHLAKVLLPHGTRPMSTVCVHSGGHSLGASFTPYTFSWCIHFNHVHTQLCAEIRWQIGFYPKSSPWTHNFSFCIWTPNQSRPNQPCFSSPDTSLSEHVWIETRCIRGFASRSNFYCWEQIDIQAYDGSA